MESHEFKKLFDTEKYTVEFNDEFDEFIFTFESGIIIFVEAEIDWEYPKLNFTSSIEKEKEEKERQQRITEENERKAKKEEFLNKLSPELRDELNQFYSR